VGAAFVSVGIVFYQRRTLVELLQWGSSYSGKALPMWGSWSGQRLLTVVGTCFKSIVGLELWMFDFFQRRFGNGRIPEWIPSMGAVCLAVALFVAFRFAPIKRAFEGRASFWLLILYLIYVPFFAWWDATEPRWFNLSNIFVAGIVALIARRWSAAPYFKFALPAVFVLLGGLNFATSAWPRRFVASNPVQMAACVAEHMNENDLFLATEWNWAGYLEYVHNRDVVSFLGEVARTGDKRIATEGISKTVAERQMQNGNVYMIDIRTFPAVYQTWFTGQTGLTTADLLAFKGNKAFECVYSPFIRLDPR
jgi:hypothetical protein